MKFITKKKQKRQCKMGFYGFFYYKTYVIFGVVIWSKQITNNIYDELSFPELPIKPASHRTLLD